MKILAVNTASINSEVALFNNKYICEKLYDKHSEHLLPTIDKMLNENSVKLSEIDCYAVNLGPGSFTGIRIGVSTIKAFMVANNKPCVALNSFELVAYNIKESNFIIAINSGNKDFYYAIYTENKIGEIRYADINEIVEIANKLNIKLYANLTDKDLINSDVVNFVETNEKTMIDVVLDKYSNGLVTNIQNLIPIYVKQSQAEISLNEKIEKNLIIMPCNDVKDLVNIEKECFEDCWNEEIFKEELNLTDRFYYVAKVGEEVVGYIGLWQTGDDLNLLKLAVLPRFRKLNIATKLLDKALNLKQERMLKEFFLEVDDKNDKAINLYEKFGFKTEYVRKKYYKNGNDCLMMFYRK